MNLCKLIYIVSLVACTILSQIVYAKDCDIDKFRDLINQKISIQESIDETQLLSTFNKLPSRCLSNNKELLNDIVFQKIADLQLNDLLFKLLSDRVGDIKTIGMYLDQMRPPLSRNQNSRLKNHIMRNIEFFETKNLKIKLKKLGIDVSSIDTFNKSGLCAKKPLSILDYNHVRLTKSLSRSIKEQFFKDIDLNVILNQEDIIPNVQKFILLLLEPFPRYQNIHAQYKATYQPWDLKQIDGDLRIRAELEDRGPFTLDRPKVTSVPFPKVVQYDYLFNKSLKFLGSFTSDLKYASFDRDSSQHKGSKYFMFKSSLETKLPVKHSSKLNLNITGSPSVRLDGFYSGLKLEDMSLIRSMATFELGTEFIIKSKDNRHIKLKLVGGPEVRISGKDKGSILPYGFLILSLNN